MNISSIAGKNFKDFARETKFANNEVKLLEKEKVRIQEQIQKINEEKGNDKSKDEIIKSLKEQIENINKLIQQKQMEKIQKINDNKNKEASNSSKEDDACCKEMKQFAEFGTNYNKIKSINKVKTKIQGESRILKKEAELDKGRGKVEIAKAKEEKADKLDNMANAINKKIKEITEKITKPTEKDVKDEESSIVEKNNEATSPKEIDALA